MSKIGAVFPQTEMPSDPLAIRDYAQSLESIGYDHLIAYDHVLGADVTNRPDWPRNFYTHRSRFQEPFTLFAFLAGQTRRLGLMTGVLVLPQRQTALVAKQAANLDIFCEGRLRIGVGSGWNAVEYEALGVDFASRGGLLDEQIDYLRRLWTEEAFSFEGRFHRLTEAGINPSPVQRPIPLWVGGASPPAMRRAAAKGDGWLPVLPAEQAKNAIGSFREQVAAHGRDPALVGVETIVHAGPTAQNEARGWEEVAADCATWLEAGASHIAIDTMNAGCKSPNDHIRFVQSVVEALPGWLTVRLPSKEEGDAAIAPRGC